MRSSELLNLHGMRGALRRPAFLAAALCVLLPGARLDAQSVTLTSGAPRDVDMSAEVLDGAAGLYREAVADGELV